ncbi:replication-relaxation family protein [Paenibacillus senegalimassiliensis]|uniref:replication-relaxation family protein n=1 Tax=Paenibacillus senegalimassiliensis TaxID=1737426 RepID=UPI00073EF197|nr:replication-relaxation family protein [Paenibacillus senegalimassiliensis]
MPRQREWTDRDLSILQELYELREMTKKQIAVKHFDSEKYAHKRLYVMKKEGLITTNVYGKRTAGQTVTAAYVRLTEAGMDLLIERGLLDCKNYRARDLGLSIQQRQYITDANELFVQIPEVPYMDSRQIKRKYNLNRGNLTVGGFRSDKGDYMIYILMPDARDQTLVKIINEIKKHMKLRGFLIYYKSQSVKRAFETMSEKMNLVTGGIPVHLLPFNEWGIQITREYILTNTFLKIQKLLEPYGELKEVGGSSKYGFEYGLVQEERTGQGKGSSGPYVIELLTMNMMTLKRCLTNYSIGVSQTVGRRVLLFCYEDEVEWYKQELSSAAHVDVVGISKELI